MQIIKCKDCGKEFVVDDKELKWYADRGWDVPKRCKECRTKRKQLKGKDSQRR